MRLEDVTEEDLIKQGLIDPDVKHPIMSNFNPMTFIPKAEVSIGYKEVETPQTPACQHSYRSDWGHAGPIMVCDKCGDWHHD